MIEEQFVSLDTAKLLKEAGFRELTKTHYSNSGQVWETAMPADYNDDFNCNTCNRPTLALAARWLREKFGIHIFTNYFFEDGTWFYVNVDLKESDEVRAIHPDIRSYQSSEEAFEAGLKEAIKMIKNKDYEEDNVQ